MTIFKLSHLKEADYNPREISDEALTGLTVSIDEFGDLLGIVFNRQTGNLVAGHQRVKALKEKYGDLDISELGIILPNNELFKVRYVDWDPIKEKTANIAANNPHIQGEFTSDLKLIIDELKLEVPDLTIGLKISEIEIPKIKRIFSSDEVENIPEVKKEVFSQTGDIFILGGKHKLLCGDSTKKEDVEKLMDGKVSIACITDPPYGVDYENIERKPDAPTRKEMGDSYKDPIKMDDLLKFIDLIPSDILVMTFPIAQHFHTLSDLTINWEMFEDCVWVKNHFAFNWRKRFQQQHESILIFRRKKHKHKGIWNVESNTSTVFNHDKPSKNVDHPTIKPIKLYEEFVNIFSNRDDLVYEPFGGSGTTLIACELNDRNCYSIEISPQYIDVILRRYKNLFPESSIVCLNREFNFNKLFEN